MVRDLPERGASVKVRPHMFTRSSLDLEARQALGPGGHRN